MYIIDNHQASFYFDKLISMKRLVEKEEVISFRWEKIATQRQCKLNQLKQETKANSFIVNNKKTISDILNFVYKKSFQESDEMKRSQYIAIARKMLDYIQKNRSQEDFCFLLEHSQILKDQRFSFRLRGLDALECFFKGYELEDPQGICLSKFNGTSITNIYRSFGRGNKKIKRVERKETINDIMLNDFFYIGTSRDFDVEPSSVLDFIKAFRKGKVVKAVGKKKVKFIAYNNNMIVQKDFDIEDENVWNDYDSIDFKEMAPYNVSIKDIITISEKTVTTII